MLAERRVEERGDNMETLTHEIIHRNIQFAFGSLTQLIPGGVFTSSTGIRESCRGGSTDVSLYDSRLCSFFVVRHVNLLCWWQEAALLNQQVQMNTSLVHELRTAGHTTLADARSAW